jgi:hypothetical protein
MNFDALCRVAGRRILARMSPEERGTNDFDLTDPADVLCRIAADLSFERQTFSVTMADVEKRLHELAGVP